jgi:hypothetical protein
MTAEPKVFCTLSFSNRSDGDIDMSFTDDESGGGYVLPISPAEYEELQSRLASATHVTLLDFVVGLRFSRGTAGRHP